MGYLSGRRTADIPFDATLTSSPRTRNALPGRTMNPFEYGADGVYPVNYAGNANMSNPYAMGSSCCGGGGGGGGRRRRAYSMSSNYMSAPGAVGPGGVQGYGAGGMGGGMPASMFIQATANGAYQPGVAGGGYPMGGGASPYAAMGMQGAMVGTPALAAGGLPGYYPASGVAMGSNTGYPAAYGAGMGGAYQGYGGQYGGPYGGQYGGQAGGQYGGQYGGRGGGTLIPPGSTVLIREHGTHHSHHRRPRHRQTRSYDSD